MQMNFDGDMIFVDNVMTCRWSLAFESPVRDGLFVELIWNSLSYIHLFKAIAILDSLTSEILRTLKGPNRSTTSVVRFE
jgi:hypothetical protein